MAMCDDGQQVATAVLEPGLPDAPHTTIGQPSLPPLAISALMVTKADLIAALRVYLPQLSDIELIDGERFLLSVGSHASENGAD
ncbi:MAG: hypothetical protein IT306_24460 [Chloroflexi bacterium]|nr:hypothetical protein [Chloroflexota bacterium]